MSNPIYTSPACSCIECKQAFSTQSIHTHYIRKHTNISTRNSGKGTTKFLLKCSCIICKKELTSSGLSQHIESHNVVIKYCPKCHKEHTKNGLFCSRSCANTRHHSNETKNKIKLKVQSVYDNKSPYTKIGFCTACFKAFKRINNNRTCSPECKTYAQNKGAYKGGKASAAKMIKRSKDEITLYELCCKHYIMVEHNIPMFNGWDADIIIHDIKTAILWNGPWHYRETGLSNHSLKQVQNRDRIKCNIIKNMGWNVLIFEDRYYTPESAFLSIIS